MTRQTAADTKLRRWLTTMQKGIQHRHAQLKDVTRPGCLRPRIAELMPQLTALDYACLVLERSRRAPHAKRRK